MLHEKSQRLSQLLLAIACAVLGNAAADGVQYGEVYKGDVRNCPLSETAALLRPLP